MWQYNHTDELYHYGVKGMKWGVRRALRGHAGPGVYVGGPKRRLAKYKNELDTLNKGGHLSVGFTKERQAAYDARDRKLIEKKIAKLEARMVETGREKAGRILKRVGIGTTIAVAVPTTIVAAGMAKIAFGFTEIGMDILKP